MLYEISFVDKIQKITMFSFELYLCEGDDCNFWLKYVFNTHIEGLCLFFEKQFYMSEADNNVEDFNFRCFANDIKEIENIDYDPNILKYDVAKNELKIVEDKLRNLAQKFSEKYKLNLTVE